MRIHCGCRAAQRVAVLSLGVIINTFAASPAWAVDLTRLVNFQIGPQRLSTALLEFSTKPECKSLWAPR